MSDPLAFEIWKAELRDNCETGGKLTAFNAFDDFVLLLLFEQGIQPMPQAIIANGHRA